MPEWLEKVAEEAIGSSYGPAGGKFTSRDRREVNAGDLISNRVGNCRINRASPLILSRV